MVVLPALGAAPMDKAMALRYAACRRNAEECMVQISRRSMLAAGVALPGIVRAAAFSRTASTDAGELRRFEDVAGFEAGEPAAKYPLAILPLGSLEFHGPHNPLGSDTIIISGIAEHVTFCTQSLLFPTITFTQCPAHTAHFTGTMSVRPEVMTMYFADVLGSILRLGFREVFILNGHDGNIGPGRGAIAQVADEVKDLALLFASWWEFLPGETMKTMDSFIRRTAGMGTEGHLKRPRWQHFVLTWFIWKRRRICRSRRTFPAVRHISCRIRPRRIGRAIRGM